jgi:hypothetical protein
MSRWNRSNFFVKSIVNDRLEIDMVYNFFNENFKVKRDMLFYTIREDDIQRPDLISIKNYGENSFWWIIGKINSIDDWWNDVKVGDIIKIPDKLDIEDFYSEVKKRIREIEN